MNANTKYWVLVGLGAISAALTYIVGQPVVSETVIISGAILGITFFLHDVELAAPPSATP